MAGVFESRTETTATTFSHPEGQLEHAPPPPRPFGLVAALIRSTPSALCGVSKPRSEFLRTSPVKKLKPSLARIKLGAIAPFLPRNSRNDPKSVGWRFSQCHAGKPLFPACLSGNEMFPHLLKADFHELRIFLPFGNLNDSGDIGMARRTCFRRV